MALMIGGAAVLIAGLTVVVLGLGRPRPLEGSGTVEARNIRVGSKVGGRIVAVNAREGDRVERGQVLVVFDDQELQASLDQARASVAQARARQEMLERGYRREDIEEARAALARARAEMEQSRHGYRDEQVAQARADLERAEVEAQNAEQTWQRVQALADQGFLSRQRLDDAEAACKAAQARWQSARERAAELERGYRREEVAAAEARFQQAEAVYARLERGYRPEEIAAARAELLHAEGQLREAEAHYRERHVAAPADAVVETLDVRPGDLVAPNVPIALLLERDQLYLRIYVPETQIGRVRSGQWAEVRVDSFPRRTFRAAVEQINQKAEFLPRNIQTREERVHQVIGVKLRIQDPEGVIRAGMAADVTLVEE